MAARSRRQTKSGAAPVSQEPSPDTIPAGASPPDGNAVEPGSPPAVPRWLRNAAAMSWRLLVVAAAVALVVYVLAYLRIVVLPVIIALLLTTLLLPVVRWLKRRRFGDGAAAGTVMLAGLLLVVGVVAIVAPALAAQFDELGQGVQDGIRQVSAELAKPPFNMSEADINAPVDQGIARLREDSGALSGGALRGAVLVGEVLTGIILTLLLLFFFLKDGARIWAWMRELLGEHRYGPLDEVGRRSLTALAGYVHGIALVGVVDAVLIGLGLLILGVPLVVPLMLLTFIGAFFPLIGAFTAGLAAVLVALVSQGIVTALIVLGIIILVQQVEGHLLYPLVIGRTVRLHPVAVILALAVGGIVAGLIGVFLAVPVAAVVATALDYTRGKEPPPAPATAETAAA